MPDNDKARGVHDGREWSVSGPAPAGECYPKTDSYTWGEFAGLAIEMGGYSDLSLVDPYTGRRFWCGYAFKCDEHARALNQAEPGEAAMAVYAQSSDCGDCHAVTFYAALRGTIATAEAVGFPDRFRDAPDDLGAEANA